jgi:hypothetical protein
MRSRCCPCVCVCVFVCDCVSPLSLLGNSSENVPLLLLGNGYVFFAVRVVSKERRRLVIPRTFCIFVSKIISSPSTKYYHSFLIFPTLVICTIINLYLVTVIMFCKSANYEAPHYVIFFIFLLFSLLDSNILTILERNMSIIIIHTCHKTYIYIYDIYEHIVKWCVIELSNIT